MLKKQIIFLVGPTAVGKSKAAVELAKMLNAEIISCDSMQVYRRLNILANKPSEILREAVPHHLIDTIEPDKEFSAADFKRHALCLIEEIHSRKRLPLITGGTGLYIRALIDGLFEAPEKDLKFRSRLERFAKRYGVLSLHKRLEKIDPESAKKIHPNDLRRLIRALEIFELTKKPISELQKNTQGLNPQEYKFSMFGLRMPREELYKRIDNRVEEMFNNGLVKEVRRLIKRPLSKTASMALGIKELKGYFEGRYDLEEAKRLLSRNTRRYARRQMIYCKTDARIKWIDISENDAPKKIADKIWKRLS